MKLSDKHTHTHFPSQKSKVFHWHENNVLACRTLQADKDDLINDAAAIAESIQPKGNTLSSTNVVTPVPFLLRHTLREYQVINGFILSIDPISTVVMIQLYLPLNPGFAVLFLNGPSISLDEYSEAFV